MTQSTSTKQRIKSEMVEYLMISAYLLVCFSILILYENSVRQGEGNSLLSFSTAVVKALIIGKFVLIGKALRVGERAKPRVLLYRIVWKSVCMLIVLLIFVSIEEITVGLVHGREVSQVVGEFVAKSWVEKLAPSLLMLLILIPLITYEEVDKALGKGKIQSMLLERR